MATSQIKTVGVIGMGLMGWQVAHMAASAGFKLVAVDKSSSALRKGMRNIRRALGIETLIPHNRPKEADDVFKRIFATPHIDDVHDCDIVIEAIMEDTESKAKLFQILGEVTKPGSIFASNSATLPVKPFAMASGRPKNVVGLHFFEPERDKEHVEIVDTDCTDPETIEIANHFIRDIGKSPILCHDSTGRIVERLHMQAILQAMLMVDKRAGSVPDIEASLSIFGGMGPLSLADHIGLDKCLEVLRQWKSEVAIDDREFVIPKCLEDLVSQGMLGEKTGSGFFMWDSFLAYRSRIGKPVEYL